MKIKTSVKSNNYSFIIDFGDNDPTIFKFESFKYVPHVQHIINSVARWYPHKQLLNFDVSHEIYKKYNSFRKRICKLEGVTFEHQVPENWYGQSFQQQQIWAMERILNM